MQPDFAQIAQYIDHTLLAPDATEDQIRTACEQAKEFGFKTVCVERQWVALVSKLLAGTDCVPIAVVGFPSGEVATEVKVAETRQAVEDGAKEIDMVVSRSRLKAKDYGGVLKDIHAVVEAARDSPVKVILETCELTHDEKVVACALAVAAGAAFVKTSTGFSTAGATVQDIQLMRETVGPKIGVKASGGVRSREQAIAMLQAGATRLGTSGSVAIVSAASTAPSSHAAPGGY